MTTTTAPALTLSQMASRIAQITRSHAEAMDLDAGFDGGEFSGPAHYRAIEREVAQALRDGGWTADRYDDALIARTSERFVHFSGLSAADAMGEVQA